MKDSKVRILLEGHAISSGERSSTGTKQNVLSPKDKMIKLTILFVIVNVILTSGCSQRTDGYVYIKPGAFTMGSPVSESGQDSDNDEVQHIVTLTRGFWMKETEVTQVEYERLMSFNPSYFKGANRPVETVSWYNAIEFCNRLSNKERLTPCYERFGDSVTWNQNANGYRLPTEAEWEYACRAGSSSPFAFGSCLNSVDANYNGDRFYAGCSNGKNRSDSWNVKSGKANAWGLYDMHGNVFEWCYDWYDNYSSESVTDPTGPTSGSIRVYRGGSWGSYARDCRSANRGASTPGDPFYLLGFRPVRFD
jgi:formylglycine-generating enzyme